MHYIYTVLALALVPLLAAQPARAQNDPTIHMVTYIDVAPAAKDQAAALLRPLAEQSRKDAGNLRFDVSYQKNRTNHFTVMENWKDQAANDTHELAAHTRAFRGVLTPITGALYDQRWYKAL